MNEAHRSRLEGVHADEGHGPFREMRVETQQGDVFGWVHLTLAYACVEDIYRRAREPAELEIHPPANHGLDQVRDRMKDRLLEWLLRVLPADGDIHA